MSAPEGSSSDSTLSETTVSASAPAAKKEEAADAAPPPPLGARSKGYAIKLPLPTVSRIAPADIVATYYRSANHATPIEQDVTVPWANVERRLTTRGNNYFRPNNAKLDNGLWMPAVLRAKGASRTNNNVAFVTCIVLDLDDNNTFADILFAWRHYDFFCHTSFSHTAEHQKWRIIIPVSRPMKAEGTRANPSEYTRVYEWVRARCRATGLRIDKQTSNPSRIWALPYSTQPKPHADQYKAYFNKTSEFGALDVEEILSGTKALEQIGIMSGKLYHRATHETKVVLAATATETTLADLYQTMRAGEHHKTWCPFLNARTPSGNPGWVYKTGAAIYAFCSSDKHGHKRGEGIRWVDQRKVDETSLVPSDPATLKRLRKKMRNGEITSEVLNTDDNLVEILTHDPRYIDAFWYDEFEGTAYTSLFRATHGIVRITDPIRTKVHAHLSRAYGVRFPHEMFRRCLELVIAEAPTRNSLKEELESYSWDGTARLSDWMRTITGCPDDAYHRAVSRKFIISLVARAYEPGCKVDTVPMFKGAQGCKKSTMLRYLVGDERYASTHFDVHNPKDFALASVGVWLWELGELTPTRKADVNQVKNFITDQSDTFRGFNTQDQHRVKRHTVFAGTTNTTDFLKDPTGNRRFWPVECRGTEQNPMPVEWLTDNDNHNRKQLFAEAVLAYKQGEVWYFDDPEVNRLHQEQISRFLFEPAHTMEIRDYLEKNPEIYAVVTRELWELALENEGSPNQQQSGAIARAMEHVPGWEKGVVGKSRGYYNLDRKPEHETLSDGERASKARINRLPTIRRAATILNIARKTKKNLPE